MEEIAFCGGYSPQWRITEHQGQLSVSDGGGSRCTRCTFLGLFKTVKTGLNGFVRVQTPDRLIRFAVGQKTKWKKKRKASENNSRPHKPAAGL